MSEKSNHTPGDTVTGENLRKLEHIKAALGEDPEVPITPLPNVPVPEKKRIGFDLGQNNPEQITPAAEAGDQQDAERVEAGVARSDKESVDLRKSDDYKLLQGLAAEIVKEGLTPNQFSEDLFRIKFHDQPIDPKIVELFLADHEKFVSQNIGQPEPPKPTAGKITPAEEPQRVEDSELAAELAAEAKYYDELRVHYLPEKLSTEKPTLAKEPAPVKKREIELLKNFSQTVFEELMQFNIKGMTDSEINKLALTRVKDFTGPDWVKDLMRTPGFAETVRYYLKQRSENNFKPGARIGSEIIFEHIESSPALKSWEEINAPTGIESDRRVKQLAREVWDNFVYSGKVIYDALKGEHKLSPDADLDVKVSMFLLKQAGIKGAFKPEVVRAGESRSGASNIDTGNVRGVKMVRGEVSEIEEKGVKKGQVKARPTVFMDHHQPERDVIDTSVSTMVFNILNDSNILDPKREKGQRKEQAEMWQKLKLMEEMAVADDNAKLMTNKDQFEKSANTLRGLHRYFKTGDELYEAIGGLWKPGMSLEKLLDEPVPPGFTIKFNLGKDATVWVKDKHRHVNKRIDARADQKFAIDQAKEMLFVSDEGMPNEEKLKAVGRLVESKTLGKCIVLIDDKRLNAGHDAVKSYFGENSSLIVIDSKAQSFLINTHNDKIDLSRLMAGFKQGVPIRGAMFIKPRGNGESLKVSPKEILLAVGVPEKEADDLLAVVNRRKRGEGEPRQDKKNKKEERLMRQVKNEIPLDPKGTLISTPVPGSVTVPETTVLEISEEPATSERWQDKTTGIEFSRKLNEAEEGVKAEVDDEIFNLLTENASNHPRYASYKDKDKFVESYVSQGLKDAAILQIIKRKYKERSLPVK